MKNIIQSFGTLGIIAGMILLILVTLTTRGAVAQSPEGFSFLAFSDVPGKYALSI